MNSLKKYELYSAGKLTRYRVTVENPPMAAHRGFVMHAESELSARQQVSEKGYVVRKVVVEPNA